jgi:glutathione synthase/RimK-type ligase-like ATP-grasp enzyme
VVLTPNPFNHAVHADKRNLVVLSDPERMAGLGADAATIETLSAAIPRTIMVTRDNADELWAGRKDFFFKPAKGYGSKGAFRGDKLTRSTWAQIVDDASSIAQTFVPPSTRMMRIDGETVSRKVDVRLYTYRGEPLLVASRVYQGQTTNMRTPGGGFAPVLLVDPPSEAA